MNREAVRMTLLAGQMLGCETPPTCKFDRKNYFYPDMPKNYQISQYDLPFCLGGGVPLHRLAFPKDVQKSVEHPDRVVRLTRIHLEEDVAKSTHFGTGSGIDFNRAGTPLMEIVSEPDLETPEEAFAYLTSLKQILVNGGVSDADMEKGQLRCDCNVSVRPVGQAELGAKIEIKNMNSISGVRRALAFEIARQMEALARGETLRQETRRWDDDAGQTFLMRTKESAHDYRYFPDPDLLPVETAALVEEARAAMPELPGAKRSRFVADYGVSESDAAVLADDAALAGYFEAAARGASKPKTVANWILNDLLSALAAAGIPVAECPLPPEEMAALARFVEAGRINAGQAKEVLAELLAGGKTAAAVIAEKGLEQESDTGVIESLCDAVIAENPKVVEDYRAGKAASINFLKGQVMKRSKGKANPAVVGEILAAKLA
jgi:aspartyl-tRNA(Asn)/glutamyl-tRNA(Gln) amidotransferase subunit B